jgi:RNA polymerase sigma factor (sigma-70 family)
MPMPEDIPLLRRFVDEGSDAAFAELVRLRINFVYGIALRQVGGDAHLARDVTQEVFLDLARKAPALARRPVLVNWLYTSTRFAAAKVVRRQARWLSREQRAHAMDTILAASTHPEPDWDQLRPVLDEAMHELGHTDRTAVLLRYFENRPLADIGAQLGLAEHAAGRRVERALEKLHRKLVRRGITSTAAALGSALLAQPAVTAPPSLAATIATASLQAAAAGSISALTALTYLHTAKVVFGLAGAAGLVGVGFYVVADHAPSAPSPVAAAVAAPLPPARLPLPTTTRISREVVASAAQPAAATAFAPEIQVQAEFAAAAPSANPLVVGAMAGTSRAGYTAEELTPLVNRALRGGRNYEQGKKVYESIGCTLCHLFGGGTGGIGPDLSGVGGRFGAFEILQSILEPSAVISDLYGTKIITTKDGKTFTGKLDSEGENEVVLIQNYVVDPNTMSASWAGGPKTSVKTVDIVSLEESATSLMPPGLINGNSVDEIADMMAYLMSGGNPASRMFQPLAGAPASTK